MKHNEIAEMEGTLVYFTQEPKKGQGVGVTISKDTAGEFSKTGGWVGMRTEEIGETSLLSKQNMKTWMH